MTIFIFENVAKLTGNYHANGGLVVIAESKEDAIELLNKEADSSLKLSDKDWVSVESYEIISQERKVFIFPDAGCC